MSELPTGWTRVDFDESVDVVSDRGFQIKQKDYLPSGKLPVVDQGDGLIGGYTDYLYAQVTSSAPVIVFGDHTRRFKFVKFPFAVGADGVKLFSPASIWNAEFLFLQLGTIDLENRGYGRHYQHLRKESLVLAPLAEQARIVEKLEELLSDLDAGVAELKAAQKKLTQYRQSLLKAAVEGALTAQWREQKQSPSPQPLPPQGGGTKATDQSPLPPRGGGAGGEGESETGAQLLERILRERRTRWETKQLAKFNEQGKTPPKDWQKKYPEPVQPDTSNLPALPKGWVWASVDCLLSDIETGKSFKCVERPPTSDEIGVVKVSAVSWGEFDEQESKTCTNEERVNLDLLVKAGDFLFSRANTVELVGACVIAKATSLKVMLSDKILRLVLMQDDLKPWLLYLLRSKIGRRQIELLATGNQESMKNIGQERLRSIAIPIGPKDEIDYAIALVEQELASASQQIAANELALKQSAAQRQNILRAAFAGQLVPQDLNDEPASVLLERIRAERAAALKSTPKRQRASAKTGT